jgi:hypothetical protein
MMRFDFLSRMASKRAAERETDYETYRRMLTEAALSDKPLADGKVEQIVGLQVKLGLDDKTVDEDGAAIRDYAEAVKASAGIEQVEAALKANETALCNWQTETQKLIDGRAGRLQELYFAVQNSTAARDRAAAAKVQAESLAIDYWKILSKPDPEAEKYKVHLFQSYASTPPASPYHIIDFESVMALPTSFAMQFHFGSLHPYEFTPVSGQTQAELDALLKVARDWVGEKIPQPVYLVKNADAVKMYPRTNYVCYEETLAELRFEKAMPEFDPNKITFVPYPGQQRRELDKWMADLTKRWEAHPWIKNRRPQNDAEDMARITRNAEGDETGQLPRRDRFDMANEMSAPGR